MTYLFDRSQQQGRLAFTDRDRFDLLHRMSTNDFKDFKQGEGRSTVLTTALARIIDQLLVYHCGETALVIANQPAKVRAWLQKHIFFQDKVKIRDVSSEQGQLVLHGSSVASIVELFAPGVSNLPLHHFVQPTLFDQPVLIAKTFPLGGDGYLIVAPMVALESLKQSILQDSSVVFGNDTDYERLRIEAGLAGTNHELTEGFIPLEAALWDSVSFSKGCYIGQEIIARMESRNKLAKTIVTLQLSDLVPMGTTLALADRTIGSVTSVAQREDGTVLAIGFIKPDQVESNQPFDLIANGQIVGTATLSASIIQTHR